MVFKVLCFALLACILVQAAPHPQGDVDLDTRSENAYSANGIIDAELDAGMNIRAAEVQAAEIEGEDIGSHSRKGRKIAVNFSVGGGSSNTSSGVTNLFGGIKQMKQNTLNNVINGLNSAKDTAKALNPIRWALNKNISSQGTGSVFTSSNAGGNGLNFFSGIKDAKQNALSSLKKGAQQTLGSINPFGWGLKSGASDGSLSSRFTVPLSITLPPLEANASDKANKVVSPAKDSVATASNKETTESKKASSDLSKTLSTQIQPLIGTIQWTADDKIKFEELIAKAQTVVNNREAGASLN